MATPEGTPGSSRLRRLFDVAVELPVAERERFLAELDAEDGTLHDQLVALLAVHERAGEFLEDSPLTSLRREADPLRLIGERLGDYRVVGLLGRGGMGTVFLGQRADGAYDQTVAVKLLDALQHEARSILRFERERQTLAKLTHPNIARLLDGGTTAEGAPFLVMEYVEGEPIDRYCDRRRLGIAARLRVFLQVCAGVQHAHRHLVVHRDLKPSNILVARDGEVKLLDFGIARLLGELDRDPDAIVAGDRRRGDPAWSVTLTAPGAVAFTPGYASPEQLRGEEVSAASDVFALGLILYELLCGAHPYAPHREDPNAMSAAILSQETTAPSLALRAAGEGSTAEVAARRGVELPRLRRQVRGDLDAILLKALAKEEGRRYASAGELAADLERHLDHRPVVARAGERVYPARRFVRRHRLAVAAASLLVVSLVAGLAATSWQASRAERAQAVAERRFEQVQELARALLFDVHDAVARLPGATPARHLLVERALVYLDSLRAEAAGDAALQLDLADAYERIGDIQGNPQQANLGDTETAAESYRAALALRLEQPPEARRSPEVRAAIARTHHRIGDVLWWTGDTQEAGRQLDRAIAEWQELAEAEPDTADWRRLWAQSLTSSARVHSWNGDHDEALQRYRAAEELLVPLLEGDGDDVERLPMAVALALVHQGRGETLGWMGETDRALGELERARLRLAGLSSRKPLDAPLRRRLFLVSLRRSSLLADRSVESSIASFPETLAIARELAAADPANALARRDLSLAHASFGDTLSSAGDQETALQHFRQAQAIQRQLALEDPNNLGHQADLANSAVRVGYLLGEEGEQIGALASFDEALALRLRLREADADDAANRRDLAVIHSARGDALDVLAADAAAGRDPAADRRASCAAYRLSLDLWRELERTALLREFDRPQLDHAAAQVAATCAGGVSAP